MPHRLSFILAALLVLFAAPAAKADVSWNLIVTAATRLAGPGGPPLVPLPITAGVLTVADALFLRGSLFYEYFTVDLDEREVFVSGDTGFGLSFSFPGQFIPAMPTDPDEIRSNANLFNASVGLAFSGNGEITGDIVFNSNMDNVHIPVDASAVHSGFIASDNFTICGGFTQCEIEGYW
jgi:hypothetical protein